jgi:hypothetical protein
MNEEEVGRQLVRAANALFDRFFKPGRRINFEVRRGS